ncbi:MAG: PQQ-dependent sugar dehydrogenase [Gemmatimonadota bacterium]|nr:PQQ-dependent sugar dehydrogenase [Gemmatimonadota bacterium]
MWTHRAALLSIFVLSSSVMACGQRAGSQSADRAGSEGPSDTAAAAACQALEKRQPKAPDQRPAFAGQTRVCGVKSNVAFDVAVVAKGLEHPSAVEPLAGGDLLVTEKPGRMRIVSSAGKVGQPLSGLPVVAAAGQGGLLDVALSPTFDADRTIFWSYSEPRRGGNATSVARGVLSADRRSLGQVKVIFRAMPTYDGDNHFGSRLAFGPDSMLYITLGERSDAPMRPQAQQLDSHMGKIIRISPNGAVPKDNPFAGQANALPEIWSRGHRNVQAAAFDSQGQLWGIEHGTNGGDELNRVEKGKNYGWPIQAYGEEYSGSAIAGAATAREGMEQPVYYWDPVIAPSGAQFYSGDAFPAWKGNLFVGGMKDHNLVRLILDGDRVTGEEHLLEDRGQRVRDVRQGPDGSLYLVTDEKKGELWKITPRR